MESQTLAGEEGALIAIQTATVHAAEHPQSTFDVQLPVRSHRDRRELVELRALSTFELDRLPGDSPWMLYAEALHDGGRLKVNGTVVADLPTTDAETTVRQLSPSRFEVP